MLLSVSNTRRDSNFFLIPGMASNDLASQQPSVCRQFNNTSNWINVENLSKYPPEGIPSQFTKSIKINEKIMSDDKN